MPRTLVLGAASAAWLGLVSATRPGRRIRRALAVGVVVVAGWAALVWSAVAAGRGSLAGAVVAVCWALGAIIGGAVLWAPAGARATGREDHPSHDPDHEPVMLDLHVESTTLSLTDHGAQGLEIRFAPAVAEELRTSLDGATQCPPKRRELAFLFQQGVIQDAGPFNRWAEDSTPLDVQASYDLVEGGRLRLARLSVRSQDDGVEVSLVAAGRRR